MSFLCKEQITKGLYLSIGAKYRVPNELILFIYRLSKDDSLVRDYHTDAIYRNTIPNYSCHNILPLGRGLEWAIKWKKDDIKKVRHTQIHVFGEKNYLLKQVDYLADGVFQYSMKPAHNKLKIKYLNTSPMEEVLEDYLTYLFVDRDPSGRLYIDNYGEGFNSVHDPGY